MVVHFSELGWVHFPSADPQLFRDILESSCLFIYAFNINSQIIWWVVVLSRADASRQIQDLFTHLWIPILSYHFDLFVLYLDWRLWWEPGLHARILSLLRSHDFLLIQVILCISPLAVECQLLALPNWFEIVVHSICPWRLSLLQDYFVLLPGTIMVYVQQLVH